MDEDEDTRLIADNPGYPVAVVPTQSSRTADFSWVNNKITLGSKPVQNVKDRNSVNNPRDENDTENICKHCNIEFANNNLLIKHLFELVAAAKKPPKRNIEKAKGSEECQLSKKSKIIDKNGIKSKKHSNASEENFTVTSHPQVEQNLSNNEHIIKQTSRIDVSSATDDISNNKVPKVRFSIEDNKDTGKVKKLNYIYKCKECNIYFGNKRQMNQHKICVHPDLQDIFVKIPTDNSLKENNKPEHNALNLEKAKDPEECQSSGSSNINDNIINKNKYSVASEENSNVRSQTQVESSTSNVEHLIQQTSINASSASSNVSNKTLSVQFSVQNNKNTKRVEQQTYIYKCKECNTYVGNRRQMKQHKVNLHPDHEDIFVKLAATNISKKRKNTENKVANIQRAKTIAAPKKESNVHKNKQISFAKTLSYGPEVTESLSLQNKAGPSLQQDTVNQVVANRIIKKVTVSKTIHKKKPIKKTRKVSLNSRDQTQSPVRVINSETTELFKSDCGLHFISCKSLQKHSEACNGSCNTPKINCKKCGYVFPLDTLGIHQSRHHNNNSINLFDIVTLSQKRNILQCTSCLQKFIYKKPYQTHVLKCKYKIKTQNFTALKTLYKCSQCNLHYATRIGLKDHLKKNHLIHYAIKKCDDCNILLSNRSFNHHVKIHHDVFGCKLKDLTIKYNDNKDEKMQNKMKTSKTRTIKSVDHTIPNFKNSSFNTTNINESVTDTTESSIHSTDKVKDINISVPSNINNELTYKPKDVLPNVLYKCNKCEIHFLTSSAHKEHVSSKNCPDFIESEIGKCSKCHLMFQTKNLIEHLANQHFDKSKTASDFLIICNETVEIHTHCKETCNISNEHTQPTKISNQNYNDEAAVLQKTSDTNVQNLKVYDKAETVKLFAEAWIRNKCTNAISFANIDSTCFTNLLYRCPKCTLNYLNHAQLKLHVSECEGDSSDWAQCPICCYSFGISSLSLHIYVHHAKMELKRENFEIRSSESSTDSLKKLVNKNMQVQKESNHNKKILNTAATEDTRIDITEADKCIDLNTNSPDIIDLVSSLESKDSQSMDDIAEEANLAEKYIDTIKKSPDILDSVSSEETKSIILSNFKSSRAKIAWAIDSIEDSNRFGPNKSPRDSIEEEKENCRDNVTTNNKAVTDLSNRTIIQMPATTNETSNEVEKNVSEEIESILSLLDGNSTEQTKVDNNNCSPNKITNIGEDVQTSIVFENIDTLVNSIDKISKNSKQQDQNIVLYKCKICCIHFMTPKSLQIHITNGVHNEDLGTNCKICHITFNKHTVTKHITKHHEKMNKTPVNYTIKTNYRADSRIKRQQVVSDVLNKNQPNKNILKYAKNMVGLTRKQKLSLYKVLKKSNQTTATTETPGSSKQTQNPILKQLLNERDKNEKQKDVDNNSVSKALLQQHHDPNKGLITTNSTNSSPVQTLNPSLEIIDLSYSQDSEEFSGTVTDPTPLQLNCTKTDQSSIKRTFSADSYVTNFKKTATITKTRTKSEDQRKSKSYTDTIANQNVESSKIMRININNSSNDKTEKSITILTKKGNSSNNKSELMPSHFRLNGVDIVPIDFKVSADIDSKKCNSVVHSTSTRSVFDKNIPATNSNPKSLETRDRSSIGVHAISVPPSLTISNITSQDPTKQAVNNTYREYKMPKASTPLKDMDLTLTEATVRNVFSKQNGKNSKTVNPDNPVTTDSSCIPETSCRSFITFEDSSFEIRATYGNDNNANTAVAEKDYTEEQMKQKKLKRKSQDSKRDSNFSSSMTTPPRKASSNALRKDPVDIIDITEETNDNNIRVPGMNRTNNFSSEPSSSKAPNIAIEKHMGAFDDRRNRRISPSTIGAGISNSPMTFPTTPNFNLFNFVNDPLFNLLSLHQKYGFHINQNPMHTTPKQNEKRLKKPSDPRNSSIYDSMQSCPICRGSIGISSVKNHLRVKQGFFSCCFCARRSKEMELSKHIQICGSRINFNSYT